jgi:hypothetical protein
LLWSTIARHSLTTVFPLQKRDETVCPVELSLREIIHHGQVFAVTHLKEVVPRCSSMVLSKEGRILEVSRAERLGYHAVELVGQKIADLPGLGLTFPLTKSNSVEHMLYSHSGDPILTLLSVTRMEMTIGLDFLIAEKSFELVLLLCSDGTSRDCSWYSSLILTGYTRMELLNHSIILMVPFLFPAVPKDVSLSCEGVHKNGRSFRVVLYLHEFANAMVCCRMRRLFVEHERDERAFQYLDDAVPSVKLGAILGTGATSIVRVGNLKSNNQIVAMKFVTKNSEELAQKEGEVLSRMSHFNIPKKRTFSYPLINTQ